jgi:hypothetical protein
MEKFLTIKKISAPIIKVKTGVVLKVNQFIILIILVKRQMTIYQNAQDKFQALFHMRETLLSNALIWIKKIKMMFNLTMELLD